jgi:hypothetical protein
MWDRIPKTGNYMYVIRPGTTQIPTGTKLLKVPSLEKLKHGLDDGYLEHVPYFNKFGERDCVAFCDEHGKQNGLQPNALAQMLWSQSYGRRIIEDHLVGPIVIIVGSPSFLAQL